MRTPQFHSDSLLLPHGTVSNSHEMNVPYNVLKTDSYGCLASTDFIVILAFIILTQCRPHRQMNRHEEICLSQLICSEHQATMLMHCKNTHCQTNTYRTDI